MPEITPLLVFQAGRFMLQFLLVYYLGLLMAYLAEDLDPDL